MYVYSVLCRMLPVSALAIPDPLLLCSWSLSSSFRSFAALMCKTQHSTKAHMDKHTNSQASQDADRQMPAKATDKQR